MADTGDGNSLLSDMPRGDPGRRGEEHAPPSEAFASMSGIRNSAALAYRPGKLFLGVIDGSVQNGDSGRFVTGGKAIGIGDDRHVLTVAGSRGGKGRAVIIPNILQWPGSVLATDPKGELATITARQRARGLGQPVHVLDPFGVAKGVAAGLRASFNPLSGIRPDSLVEDAALIADALVIAGGHDPHWDDSARNFIEGVILHVCSWPAYAERRSLVTVQELVSKGAEDEDPGRFSLEALEVDMRRNAEAGGVVQAAAADFFDRTERERSSVLSTARRHLKFLDYPGIRSVVEKHSFALEDLKGEKPITVYLCLPARHMGTCSRWLRLFVNLALQAMERVPNRPPGTPPVLICLDEFATLGKLQQIEDAAGQIAGFGVKLWPILQDLGQLKSLYGDRWETFMGNAGILQFFGNNDLTTLEWLSKRCDKTSIRSDSTSAMTYQQSRTGAGQGTSWRTEVHDLLTPGEAARYFSRDDTQLRQLVIWAGRPPLVLQRAFYDKHGLFNGQFDPPLDRA